jgi:hypothetical protein
MFEPPPCSGLTTLPRFSQVWFFYFASVTDLLQSDEFLVNSQLVVGAYMKKRKELPPGDDSGTELGVAPAGLTAEARIEPCYCLISKPAVAKVS